MLPIVPILVNALSLGIPFFIDLANRRKGKRAARLASAKAADVIANVQLGTGAVAGAVGVAVQQAVPAEDISALPEWFQIAYVVVLVAGAAMKALQPQLKKMAEKTEH